MPERVNRKTNNLRQVPVPLREGCGKPAAPGHQSAGLHLVLRETEVAVEEQDCWTVEEQDFHSGVPDRHTV